MRDTSFRAAFLASAREISALSSLNWEELRENASQPDNPSSSPPDPAWSLYIPVELTEVWKELSLESQIVGYLVASAMWERANNDE